MKQNISYLFGLLLATSALSSSAAQFMMQFSVTGFVNYSGSGVPAPTDPVTGTIFYQAANIYAPIQSFTSINMVIDGHGYSANEIGYYRFATPNWDLIGGLQTDVGSLANFTDDFVIRWYRDSLTPYDFLYTSSKRNGGFDTGVHPGNFTYFSITEVPEPATTAILFLGTAIYLARRGPNNYWPMSETRSHNHALQRL